MSDVETLEKDLEDISKDLKVIRKSAEDTSKENQALRDKQERAWEDYDKKWDELTEARKEETKKVEGLEETISQLSAKLTKAGSGAGGDQDPQIAMAKKAFMSWVSKGMRPEEQGEEARAAYQAAFERAGIDTKNLTVGNSAEGGVFVLPEFSTEIQKQVREFSPVRQLARRSTTASGQLLVPVRTAFTTGGWTGETGARPSGNDPTYARETIITHEQTLTIPISRQLLDEAQINFETELRNEAAEGLAANEASGFTTGDGNGKPNGFLNDTRVTVQDTAASNVLDADDLFDFAYDNLKTQHFNRATWGVHRTWIKRFRKLKSSATGEYLLEFSDRKALTEGTNLTLLGRPVIEMPDMPAATGTDGAKKAFVLANWQRFYWIVDSLGMTMIRDPFTAKGTGFVEFQFYARTGGKVTLPEAGIIGRIKA